MRVIGAVVAMSLILLSACSGSDPESSADFAAADPPADMVRYADVVINDGLGSSESEDGVFPRTITHRLGKTTIAQKPVRIVAVSGGQLDHLLSLDVVPIGATYAQDAELVPEYLRAGVPQLSDQLDEITEVGQRTDPNLEGIASLKPDLILGNESGLRDLYPKLADIAPTVLTQGQPTKWREDYLLLAATLGRERQAEAIMDELSAEAERISTTLSDPPPVVSLIRFSADQIRSMGTLATAGMAAAEIGVRRPSIAPGDDLSAEVSPEELAQLDGDLIIYGSLGSSKAVTDTAGGLWKSLDAVQEGNAVAVKDALWFQNAGPLATRTIMDELAELLKEHQ